MNREIYYQILGVSENAPEEEIKKAYRWLVLKWHPDKNNNSEESKEWFQKIVEAYKILSEDEEYSLVINDDKWGKEQLDSNRDFFYGIIENNFSITGVKEQDLSSELWMPCSSCYEKVYSLNSYEELEKLENKISLAIEEEQEKVFNQKLEKNFITAIENILVMNEAEQSDLPEEYKNYSQLIKEIDKKEEKWTFRVETIITAIREHFNKIKEVKREETIQRLIEERRLREKRAIISFLGAVILIFFFFIVLVWLKKTSKKKLQSPP